MLNLISTTWSKFKNAVTSLCTPEPIYVMTFDLRSVINKGSFTKPYNVPDNVWEEAVADIQYAMERRPLVATLKWDSDTKEVSISYPPDVDNVID